ncbi:MAG TPA: DUF58 domain-containing protein [Polyangiaceae bacterium]|nr:DUF58 domain-containing protein [Polyangiaceae bacterium]
MQLYPTRATFHVAIAGAAVTALGAAAHLAPVVAFGGAILLAVAFGRSLASLAVTRMRASGFEMVWNEPARVRRIARGARVTIEGEVRNRGPDPMRAVGVRPIASSMLDVSIEPAVLELPPGGVARIEAHVTARRVGRWGLHGIGLEVRGAALGGDGLFEVPLIFGNPFGFEVVPTSLGALLATPRGGRARRGAEIGRPSNLSGDGDELRELRDHIPGDPFKKIAWKASARRGRLLVREMEREKRDTLWLVVDASVELWAGAPGTAPLDVVIDEVGSLAARHLRRGDRVGLVVAASRLRAWIAPKDGPAHAALVASALASTASTADADRSELDEGQVARRVAEHARPLDPKALADVLPSDLDALAQRAEALRSRAPFAPRLPFAHTQREQMLRHYLASFGIEGPPRAEGEREKAETMVAQSIARIALERPRASAVHVWAPPPGRAEVLAGAVAALRAQRIVLSWTMPPFEAGVGTEARPKRPVADVVEEAVRIRARASEARGERVLRKLGVRLVTPTASRAGRHQGPPAEPPKDAAG